MIRAQSDFNQELMSFLAGSPTPFHAVSNCLEALLASGYERLDEGAHWDLRADGRYVVTRNGSALVAFTGAILETAHNLQNDAKANQGIRLFGAHSDSPCLRVKPNPGLLRKGFFQLGVEIYGGVLLSPWFDRDLSLAGRVVFEDADGVVSSRLIDWKRPVALIPSLAIHLDREVNNSRSINPQKELPPILFQTANPKATEFRELVLAELKHTYPDLAVARVLDYELSFYDCQPPALVGLHEDLITSARLDNLLSCFIGLRALLDVEHHYPCLLVLNDHEEVGSSSAEGASGSLVLSILNRIFGTDEQTYARVLSRSLLISADNAHGVHPNYSERHDESHGPLLNAGPVIKVNANQRYATNAVTAGFYRALSDRMALPYQVFVTRADMACGSTIGPLTATRLGVKTLDIGVPQFAMHSIRESCGSRDPHILYQVTRAFFDTAVLPIS